MWAKTRPGALIFQATDLKASYTHYMLDVYVLQQVVKQIFKFELKCQLQRPIQQEILWNSNIHLPDIHVQLTMYVACLNCSGTHVIQQRLRQ
jgi:hypothetical protein